jgi:hypothetical protein
MNGPAFSYGEIALLALAIPFAPFVAWILSDLFDALVAWFADAPDLEDEVTR